MKVIFILFILISLTLSANNDYKFESDYENEKYENPYNNQKNKNFKESSLNQSNTDIYKEKKTHGIYYHNNTVKQVGLGFLGMLGGSGIGIFLGGTIGASLQSSRNSLEGVLFGAGLGFIIGNILGTSLAIYYAGNDEIQKSSFSSTIIGTSIGFIVGVGVGVALSEVGDGSLSLISVISLTITGGIIGFNTSKKYKSSVGGGLVNIDNGNMNIGIPIYYIQKSTYDRNRSIDMFSIINMKF